MARTTLPTAPIAGLSPGVQSQGIWAGRRQLFVRFAGEAETAVLYSSEMLAKQLERATSQAHVHSILLSGRDPLSCAPFIAAVFGNWTAPLPVILESDGQRPEALEDVVRVVSMVHMLWEFPDAPSGAERTVASLAAVAAAGTGHALTLAPRDGTSDGQILRLVEQAHAAAPGTKIVIHPVPSGEKSPLDRRYATLLEAASTIHRDVVLSLRIPGPVGTR
jgi:hypothetical protein